MRKKTVKILRQIHNSQTRNSQVQPIIIKWKTTASTPQLRLLPKITAGMPRQGHHNMENMDKLEGYLHSLLYKQRYEQQSWQKKKQQDWKKQHSAEIQENTKQKRQRKNIRYLEERLRKLKSELSLEQRKLYVGYTLHEKMSNQYQQVYDSMFQKIRGVNKKEEAAQTEAVQISIQANGENSVVPQKVVVNYKRKFRIIGYVVYFAKAFPKYARIFRQLRKNYFYQNVVNGQQLLKPVQNYFSILSSFKLSELQREKERQRRRSSQLGPSFSFEEINDGVASMRHIPVTTVAEVLLHFLQKLKKVVQNGGIDDLLKVLTFYFMNRAFLADQMMITEELYRLNVDRQNLHMNLSQQQQIHLLMNFLIGKLTCFTFMVPNKKSLKNIYRRNSKLHKETNNQHFARSLFIGGLYLFHKCSQLFHNTAEDEGYRRQGNVQKLEPRDFPVPMAALQVGQKFMLTDNTSNQKRTSIQDQISFASLNQGKALQYLGMEKNRDLITNFASNNPYEQQIQNLLRDIGKNMRDKCWQFRIEHYRTIQHSAILHQNYLLKEIQTLQYGKKRLPNEDQLVESSLILIKLSRSQIYNQNQNKRSTQDQSSMKSVPISSRSYQNYPQNQNKQKPGVMFEGVSSSHTGLSSKKQMSHKSSLSGTVLSSQQSQTSRIPTVRMNQAQRENLRKKMVKVQT